MILLPSILGISAAALLLITGYLLGVQSGFRAREQLRERVLQQDKQLQDVQERLLQKEDSTSGDHLREDFGKLVEALTRQGYAVQQMLAPLARRDEEVENLRQLVQHVVTPLAQRDRLNNELANLQTNPGRRDALTLLLDQIAEKGHFWAVMLSGEEGLPLATNDNAKDFVDRLTAVASLALLFVDRISRNEAPAPLSLMMHDEANMTTLCRIFRVGGQRLLLTAVSTGTHLTPTSLDPALPKVDMALAQRIKR